MAKFIPNHLTTFDVLRGGVAISNPLVNEPGTLGFIATGDGLDRWLVSCYHVLCRPLGSPLQPNHDEAIIYHFDQRIPAPPIAYVKRADQALDCAAALTTFPATDRILGIGRITPAPIAPEVGMRVLKSGIATGVTEGIISAIDFGGAIRIESPDMRTDYSLCSPGDSGALYVDAATLRPVALHTGGVPADAFRVAVATPIDLVLQSLQLRILGE